MPSNANFATSLPEASWPLPKATPFRLAFIFTTGGLGITKAVLVSKGSTSSSTTVEWISTVILALIFQLLGSCEYNSARPRYLDFLFRYDCLERSRTLTAAVEPPTATETLELPEIGATINHQDLPQSATIITGYRLLVSTICIVFGLVKMVCSYLGLSSAMNTLDWIIAIPLTLGLYCLGLYEDHSVQLLRKLFDVDYSSQAVRIAQIASLLVLYLSGIAFCCYWDIKWFERLRSAIVYSIPVQPRDRAESFVEWINVYLGTLQWHSILVASVMLSYDGIFRQVFEPPASWLNSIFGA